jgi:putative nucleotidyltransferase with HDIG domain
VHASLFDDLRAIDHYHERELIALQSLARTIDAKDRATEQHSARVASLARQIAMRMGWAPAQAEALYQAGLLHDIGKIAVPMEILQKPSKLTDEEYAVVKDHVDLGVRILEQVLTEDQLDWIQGHHERWDGKGYPQGRKQWEIPLGARILAAADAFDAMTSDRPYMHESGLDYALKQVATCSGSQFAPDVAHALYLVVQESQQPQRLQVAAA